MNWKVKALIQNVISFLPSKLSYEGYYWLQRRFGGLKYVDPFEQFTGATETWKRIQKHGSNPLGKVFFEVGTGRVPLVPMAYWLMGAEKTITIDLNPYLKDELVNEHLIYISNNIEKIKSHFGSLLNKGRFENLLTFIKEPNRDTHDFLNFFKITYIAPGDASSTELPDLCIDYHTSLHVFEHIPLEILKKILIEGNRILKNDGLFIHRIDYSDHFCHSDKNISAVNFLQYSDKQWAKYAGNRYMYMNRLRHDDYLSLLDEVGQAVIFSDPDINKPAELILKSRGIDLDERFRTKSDDILAIASAWITSQKKV